MAIGLATLLLVAAGPTAGTAVPRPAACPFTVTLSGTPARGVAPLLVQFNATTSPPTAGWYDWSFGDGSGWNASGAGADQPVHAYATPGSYAVTVVVGAAGCDAGATTPVIVTGGPVHVACRADPTQGRVPLTVSFRCTAEGGTGTFVNATWAFGDGDVGSGLAIDYSYTSAGAYTARLTVTDSNGTSNSTTIAVSATDGSGPSATPVGPWELLELVGAAVAVGLAVGVAYRRSGRPGDRDAASEPPPPGIAVHDASAGDLPSSSPTPAAGAPPVPPGERTDRPPRSRPNPDALRLTERVVLHLGAQGRTGPSELATPGQTQAGLAEALGARQNSLTNVLRRLEAAGIVEKQLRHVTGQPRRLRAYQLTSRGESLWKDLRSRRGRGPSG